MSKDEFWTWILSPNYQPYDPDEKFSIIEDQKREADKWEELPSDEDDDTWAVFNPDRFHKEHMPLKTEDYLMDAADLKERAG